MGRNKSLLALNAGVFLLMIGVGMMVALLPQKIIDLSGSVTAVGYLAAAFAVTYVVTQVPIGRLADQIGFKTLLALGYGLSGLTGLLYYSAGTANMIFLGRALQGIAEVPVWALAPALLSLQYAETKGRAIGIYNAAFHLGLSLGPLLGIGLMRIVGQSNPAFLVYAGVSFVGGVIVYLSVDNPTSHEAVALDGFDYQQLLSFMTDRLTLVMFCGISLYGAGYGLAVTMIPAYLILAKGFDQAAISFTFFLFYITISLVQLIVGPASDRQGRREFMIGGLLTAAIGLGCFAVVQPPWIHVALSLISLGLGMFCVASLAYLNEAVADSLRGTISGAYYLFWGLGYFLGPLLVAGLGPNIGFYGLAGLLVIETVLLLLIGPKR